MPDFLSKWRAAAEKNQSRLVIGLAPNVPDLPEPAYRYDDPFLPFSRAIIEATQDLACAYSFDLAAYLALGAAGAKALERSIPRVPSYIPTILHAPFARPEFARAAYQEAFSVDAVTLISAASDVVTPYIIKPKYGAFIAQSASIETPTPPNLGLYNQTHFIIGGENYLWISREILYADGGANYAESARAAAQTYRQMSLTQIDED